MHFEHRIDVAASPAEVWEFLWRAEEVGACLPGCRAVRTLEPRERYEATIEERVGPFRAHFDWDITIEQLDQGREIRLAAQGKDSRLGATARAEMLVRLDAENGAGTRLDIGTDLLITGRVATLGQVVIKRKADQVVSEFARALRERLNAEDGQHADS